MSFVVPADHRVKTKESKKIDKYLDLEKLWNMKVTVISIVIDTEKSPKAWKGDWWNWKNQNYPDRSINKIGSNTKKGPGNLRRLAAI